MSLSNIDETKEIIEIIKKNIPDIIPNINTNLDSFTIALFISFPLYNIISNIYIYKSYNYIKYYIKSKSFYPLAFIQNNLYI